MKEIPNGTIDSVTETGVAEQCFRGTAQELSHSGCRARAGSVGADQARACERAPEDSRTRARHACALQGAAADVIWPEPTTVFVKGRE